MTAVGGSIQSLSIRGRIFPVAADNDVNRKLGGFENEVQANGNGSGRIIKTRVPLSIEGLQIEIDDNRADQEFLQEIADGKDFVPVVLSLASGIDWSGRAILTGDVVFSTQSALATINLMGQGTLEQQ